MLACDAYATHMHSTVYAVEM